MQAHALKSVCPRLGGFGEEFYSSGWGGRRLLIRIRVCVGSGGSDGK